MGNFADPPPTPETQFYRSPFAHVDAVRLTEDNGASVFEWADSKPFFAPNANRDGTVITGLTIFTTTGREKADFGDWVTKDRRTNRFRPYSPDRFAAEFCEVTSGG